LYSQNIKHPNIHVNLLINLVGDTALGVIAVSSTKKEAAPLSPMTFRRAREVTMADELICTPPLRVSLSMLWLLAKSTNQVPWERKLKTRRTDSSR